MEQEIFNDGELPLSELDNKIIESLEKQAELYQELTIKQAAEIERLQDVAERLSWLITVPDHEWDSEYEATMRDLIKSIWKEVK